MQNKRLCIQIMTYAPYDVGGVGENSYSITVFYCFLSALVVIVSSCSDGEFTCKPGECISQTLICDFKTDCENGSDEEFCGICINSI